MILQYHQMGFTDYVLDVYLKSTVVGNSFIYTTYTIIAINCMLIGNEFIRQRKAAYIKKENLKRY